MVSGAFFSMLGRSGEDSRRDFDDYYRQIANAFTVRDIMVPLSQLRRADMYDEARPLFAEFDTVPYPRNGAIRGYFQKGTKVYRPLVPEMSQAHS